MEDRTQRSGSVNNAQARWYRAGRYTAASATWARTKGQEAVARAPEAQAWVESQARVLAERFRASSDKDPVERLESALIDVVAAIQQVSNRQARRVVNILVAKASAAAAVGGITGLISMFGTASGGAAIAGLHGAAATTAQLYWVGSLVGLGVAGGGVILAGAGLGLGVAAAHGVRRKLFGRRRSVDDLQEHERAVLASCAPVIKALQEQASTGEKPARDEMRIVAEQVLIPLVHHIDLHWDDRRLVEGGFSGAAPFVSTLAPLNRRKLRKATDEISRIAVGAMR